jgi:hypothetical protein
MCRENVFEKDLVQQVLSAEKEKIIQPIRVGETEKQNELVFFIKPELFDVEDPSKIRNSLQLIEDKFDSFDIKVNGMAIVPGAFLEKHEIMNRHYGFINQLSRMASTMIEKETRQRLFSALEIEDQGEHKILGGHEFLKHFDTDIATLSDIWFAQKANKLRSGFYFIEDTFLGESFILVNGFHPSQLAHFTREDHRILLMLLHTDTDWYDLKFELVGDTFPERAKPDSIRGQLYADPDRYDQKEVGINTNGVHLSAGPFEAAFEVVNFFGALLNLKPEQTPPLAIKRAQQSGFSKEETLSLLDNPSLNSSDLFSETENLNTPEAVEFAKVHLT